MSSTPVKFGILSTAYIANLIVKLIRALPDCECIAIASRDITKARAFAEKHDIPEACSYKQLLTFPIDAVYIPLPTAMIAEWAVLFAKAGKHVLVDKPLGSTKAVREITAACEEANVIFLDGTHFVHAARTKEVKRRISAGDIGNIRTVNASFSYPISRAMENIRSDTTLEPQGFLGDLGWYCARAAVTYLGPEVTSNILSVVCTATFHPQSPSCVQRGAGVVQFGTKDKDLLLSFSFDSSCTVHQRVAIIGDLGTLEIPDFVIPPRGSDVFESVRPHENFSTDTEYIYERTIRCIDNGDDFQMLFPRRDCIVVHEPGNLTQPEVMIQEFCRLILQNDKRGAKMWARESLVTQGILDAIMVEVERENSRIS